MFQVYIATALLECQEVHKLNYCSPWNTTGKRQTDRHPVVSFQHRMTHAESMSLKYPSGVLYKFLSINF